MPTVSSNVFSRVHDECSFIQKALALVAIWMNYYRRAIFNGKSTWHMAQFFRHYFDPLLI